MRIVFWNIRSGGGQRVNRLAQQLNTWQADVVALCEFRATAPSRQLAAQLAAAGLDHQLTTIEASNTAVNGLLLASRFPLELQSHAAAPQETVRWLLARVATPQPLTMGVLHAPVYVSGRKRPFLEALLAVAQSWSSGPGLLIGDTNSGLPDLDEENRAFGPLETSWFGQMAAAGWSDLFRHLHGTTRAYTWYSPNAGNGFRLDQAFVNPSLLPRSYAMRYLWGQDDPPSSRRDVLSDHAAILLELKGTEPVRFLTAPMAS